MRFVELLSQLQAEGGQPRTIVFCQTKKGVDYLVRQLNQERLQGVKGRGRSSPRRGRFCC